MPQVSPTPPPTRGVKTFQKAKSLLSFRHQGSSASAAAGFGAASNRMLSAAQPMPNQGRLSSSCCDNPHRSLTSDVWNVFGPLACCYLQSQSAALCCFWTIGYCRTAAFFYFWATYRAQSLYPSSVPLPESQIHMLLYICCPYDQLQPQLTRKQTFSSLSSCYLLCTTERYKCIANQMSIAASHAQQWIGNQQLSSSSLLQLVLVLLVLSYLGLLLGTEALVMMPNDVGFSVFFSESCRHDCCFVLQVSSRRCRWRPPMYSC